MEVLKRRWFKAEIFKNCVIFLYKRYTFHLLTYYLNIFFDIIEILYLIATLESR